MQAQLGTPAPPQPTVEERLDIQQQRIEEQAQTKVESSQKFPIRLAGMALFNAFMNSKQSGGVDYPVVAAPTGPGHDGATVRQTILGLEFAGPRAIWGGKVNGSVYMDFFAGATNSAMRIRTASIEIAWKDRSVMAGLEKPIFNPREPSSLAQVGISPLTGAGNLWLWLPQVRFEQDVRFNASTGVRAQVGAVQTREIGPYVGTVTPEAARPAAEGRFNFYHNLDEERRLEIAAGFHTSTTHAGGQSIPSNLFAMDWFFNPWKRVEFSGVFYSGQNVAHLGSGTRQGFAIYTVVRVRRAEPGRMGTTDAAHAAAAGFPSLHRAGGRCQPRIGHGLHRQEPAVRRQRLLPRGAECPGGAGSLAVADHVSWAGSANQQPL